MASRGPSSMVFLLIAAIVPMTIQAVDYVVGDDHGWNTGVDYQAWAKGKTFRVCDRLIFNYPPGVHNVFRVDGTAFRNCIKPALKEALTSGHDTIVLATPGKKWYICGVGEHCETGGQKLVINVQPQCLNPSPAAPRPSHPGAGPAPWPAPVQSPFPGPWAAKKRPFIRFFGW